MNIIKWLYQKPNHWDDITNKEISDKLFSVLIDWINEQDNLLITIDKRYKEAMICTIEYFIIILAVSKSIILKIMGFILFILTNYLILN